MNIQNKDVLITGASKGIGNAIAHRLIKDGYNVVLCYNSNTTFIDDIEQRIKEHGVCARYLQFDITDRESASKILLEDIENYGAYYGIICNAGIHKDIPFPAMDEQSWDSVLNTNLNGIYNILQPIMMTLLRSKKLKRIITMSSVAAIAGNRGQTNYSASKGAIISFTKSLAIELGKRGITVNCIAPGAIDTEMLDDEVIEHAKKIITLKRLGHPKEIASVASFLLSDDASYITKQVLSVDGGMI